MKIGIDARFYGPQEKGLGRYTQKLIEHLQKIDQENDYVVFLQPARVKDFPTPSEKWQTVTAPFRWYTLEEQLKMPRLIKSAGVDFMHFPHFNVPMFYRGPYIVTIHDLIITKHPKRRASTLGALPYWAKYGAYRMVVSSAVRRAKKVVTVSQYSRKDIMEYYNLPSDRVIVTYEAADPPNAYTPAHDLSHYNIQKPYVMYVGNAHPHKNLELLISAFARFREKNPDYHLVLVGGHDYFYKRLIQETKERGLDANVIFPGFVPDEDLGVLFEAATAYVFPSLSEGFGLPPLEAMQMNIPVISSNATCMPEVLGDAAEYFDPEEETEIIHALERVTKDEALQQQLVERGSRRVRQFSWDRMAQETLDIYQQLA